MQMIYTLEWYNIPRTRYSDLIEYHPYLTVPDYDKLFYVNTQHRIENGISLALFSLIANRLLHDRYSYNSRYLRFPLAFLLGGLVTYGFNLAILRPIYLSELERMGLTQKYLDLDLNADMMREDLEEMGITVRARHFDLEKAQQKAT